VQQERTTTRRIGAVLALSALLVFLTAAAAAQPVVTLNGGPAAAPTASPTAEEAWAVTVDADHIRSAPNRLEFETPGGGLVIAEMRAFEDRGGGNAMWRGGPPARRYATVVLTVHDGYVLGEYGNLGAEHYRIRANPNGQGRIEVPVSDIRDWCPVDSSATASAAAPADLPDWAERMRISEDEAQVVDIAVLWNASARDYWESVGDGTPEAAINSAADYMNTALANVELEHTVSIVHTEAAPAELENQVSGALDALLRSRAAQQVRKDHGADLIHFFTGDALFICGVAYIIVKGATPGNSVDNGRGLSVASSNCSEYWVVFAHEIGHNLGGLHDPPNTDLPPHLAVHPYAYGHTDLASPGDGSGTIMSYADSYEPYYSTVAVSPEGLTLGIENERENERVFKQTFSIVSAFDEHVVVTQPAPGDPPEAPDQPSIQLADSPWAIELEWYSHHSAHAYNVAMRVASDDEEEDEDEPWTWVGLFWGDLPVFRVLFWGLPQEEKLEWLIRGFNYDGVADSPILPIEMIAPAPTDLNVTVLNSTSVSMNWTDESANESGFRILGLRFENGLPLEWETLATLDADVTEAELTDLYPGAEYHLRVAAWTPNNVAESKTEEIDLPTPKPPEGPSDLSGSVENWKAATLSWSDAEVEAGYRVEARLAEGE